MEPDGRIIPEEILAGEFFSEQAEADRRKEFVDK